MKKTLQITDLIDDICPDEYGLRMKPAPVDMDHIRDIIREQSGVDIAPARKKRTLRLSRPFVRVAIAAAFVVLLSVTAYAVYQLRMADYVITPQAVETTAPVESTDASEQPVTPKSSEGISLVGYQGSPEYEAYVEWSRWLKDNPADLNALGVNDQWHETPDNYYQLYGAVTQEQADKLDEIIAEHGLDLHTLRMMTTSEQLFGVLGTEPFVSGEYAVMGGYIYNDGTFKLDGSNIDGSISFSMFTSVKGAFSMIESTVDSDYEEWEYVTSSGTAVDLILEGSRFGNILFETEGAYIYVRAANGWIGGVPHIEREELEAFADTIDFSALASLYDGHTFDIGMDDIH